MQHTMTLEAGYVNQGYQFGEVGCQRESRHFHDILCFLEGLRQLDGLISPVDAFASR